MSDLTHPPGLHEQCRSLTAAMNAMDVGINKVLFFREIMPVDELLADALHFKTERDVRLYNTLKNDMDYYGIKRDEFVKSQNFSIAAEYLSK
jgi:hypothetical protein